MTRPGIVIFKRHVAIPPEHGAWVLLLSPLIIGAVLAGQITTASLVLLAAVLAAFLLRQPVTVAVKVFSGRRNRNELPSALFWMALYGLVALSAVAFLAVNGYGFILWLAGPAAPVFAWHLWLVSRRAERRQVLMEITGSSVFALVAPAAYWVVKGQFEPLGWLLWFLVVLQSAASLVYTFLRLQQRPLKCLPALDQRLQMAMPALVITSANMILSVVLIIYDLVPPLLVLAYGVQWVETLRGSFFPAMGIRPVLIGVRQLIVTIAFTILFLLAWVLQAPPVWLPQNFPGGFL